MQRGTQVDFFLDPATNEVMLKERIVEIFSIDKLERRGGFIEGIHEIIGRFYLERMGPDPERIERFRLMMADCDLLPELAYMPPSYRKCEDAARFAYHLIRRLFLGLNAESCWGNVPGDLVKPFDIEDPWMGLIFKFTRSGPQKLVRPYEENRPIRSASDGDLDQDPFSGEPRWVMRLDGPLV